VIVAVADVVEDAVVRGEVLVPLVVEIVFFVTEIVELSQY
jgi:hypothetical protein